MPDIVFKCVNCGDLMTARESDAGRKGECSACGRTMTIPDGRQVPVSRPLRAPATKPPKQPAAGIILAGWICWGLGMLLLIVLLLIPVYVPLFIAAFVLGIIAIARKRTGAGIALVLVSVLVPPVVGLIVAAAFTGAVLLGISKPPNAQVPSRPSTPVSVLQSATNRQPPPQSAQLTAIPLPEALADTTLDYFLTGLDAAAKAIKAADTTARKDELRARTKAWARDELTNKQLTLDCRVRDVRIPRDGVAEVHFAAPDLGAYGTNKTHHLHLSFPGKVSLSLPKQDALKITTRHVLHIVGQVDFVPGAGDPLGDALFRTDGLMKVTILGEVAQLGTVRFKSAKYSIRSAPP